MGKEVRIIFVFALISILCLGFISAGLFDWAGDLFGKKQVGYAPKDFRTTSVEGVTTPTILSGNNTNVSCYYNSDCPSDSRNYCSGDSSCHENTYYACVSGECVESGGSGGCHPCAYGCSGPGVCNEDPGNNETNETECTADFECPSDTAHYCSGSDACSETTSYICYGGQCVESSVSAGCITCTYGCTSPGVCNSDPGNNESQCSVDDDCEPYSRNYCSGGNACTETIYYNCDDGECNEVGGSGGCHPCEYGCSGSGICNSDPGSNDTCTDSDGGLNYYVKGSVSKQGWETIEDFCVNSTKLSESFCNNDKNPAYVQYSCTNSCFYGACDTKVIHLRASSFMVTPTRALIGEPFKFTMIMENYGNVDLIITSGSTSEHIEGGSSSGGGGFAISPPVYLNYLPGNNTFEFNFSKTFYSPGTWIIDRAYFGEGIGGGFQDLNLEDNHAVFLVDVEEKPTVYCGDINNNENPDPDISDVTYLISYLYRDGPEPASMWSANVNGQGYVDMSDVTYLIQYLYMNGPALNCLEPLIFNETGSTPDVGASPSLSPDPKAYKAATKYVKNAEYDYKKRKGQLSIWARIRHIFV